MSVQYGGIDYSQWMTNTNPYATTSTSTGATTTTPTFGSSADTYTPSSANGCSDGKDDGQISPGEAIKNIASGVGKTIVNGVKGMFTNSEGKFSLGKTLLSIGTAAVCIAFPAVGLVACGIGVAAGTVQVGKGIYKAFTAETDAEAKAAFQDIGGGTFTAVVSAIGAKASYGAVKQTSTAGLGLKGKGLHGEELSTAMKAENSSAIEANGFSIKNLGKDCLSSTRNRGVQIKDVTTGLFKNGKTEKATDTPEGTEQKKLTKEEKAKIKDEKKKAVDDADKKLKDAKDKYWDDRKKYDKDYNDTKEFLKNEDPSLDVETDEGWINSLEEKIDGIETRYKHNENAINAAAEELSNAKIDKGGVTAILEKIKTGKIKADIIEKLPELPEGSGNILKDIFTKYSKNPTEGTWAELVNKYGYDSVMQVIEAIAGTELQMT